MNTATAAHITLTTREEQVAKLLAKGWPNKRIAITLRCETRTVRMHIVNIANRLENPENVPARTRVMLWARDQNAA